MLKKHNFYLILIVLIFILVRLPGLHLSYHQDERKYATSISVSDSNTPHPPVSKAIVVYTAKIFGRDNFRVAPFLFSVVNLLLLYYFIRFKYDIRTALWAALFFALSYYSVLASLMVDIDGAILPFFFLLSLISYCKWQDARSRGTKVTWGIILIVGLILGFLTKLSFIIVVAALILDYLNHALETENEKGVVKYAVAAGGLLALLALALWGAKTIFPYFNLARTLSHVRDYFHLAGRAYLQVLIQSAKAIIYSSPLLILPLLFLTKERLSKLRFFFIFIFISLVFYLIIFDFSRAALDKYLTFVIVPLSIIAAVTIKEILADKDVSGYTKDPFIVAALIGALLIFCSQFLGHIVPSLYPKEDWISRIIRLRWNFVFPFTGGSGPTGFYVSWLFIGLTWLVSVLLAILAMAKRRWRGHFLAMILVIGFAYNLVFIEEYLFGRINGSSEVLVKHAVSFIEKNANINRVISYNDIGGYELSKAGKYENRIYAVPKYESAHRVTLNNFHGHYLVVDIPHINPASLYGRYFASCNVVYEDYSQKISAKIYNCKNAAVLP